MHNACLLLYFVLVYCTGGCPTLGTRFQEHLLQLQACPCGPYVQMTITHVQDKMVSWFQRTWFGVNQLRAAALRCLQDSKSTYYALGYTHVAPMGKWPWRCTSTVQEGSHELHLEWIGPAAIELRCPQSLCRLAGAFHIPPFFPSER